MSTWLEWARGPIFLFAISFMILGLLRHLVLTSWEVLRNMRRAGDKSLPWGQLLGTTLKWLFPQKATRGMFQKTMLALFGYLAARVHLWKFNDWFLERGSLRRLLSRQRR